MYLKALTCLEDLSAQYVSSPFMTQGKMCEDTLLRRQVRESWIVLQEAGEIDCAIQNWKCLLSESGHNAFKWRLPSGASLPEGNVLLEKKRRHFKLELVSAMHHHYKFSIISTDYWPVPVNFTKPQTFWVSTSPTWLLIRHKWRLFRFAIAICRNI